MRSQPRNPIRSRNRKAEPAELDLVIPFTTPGPTRAALEASERMGAGLNATIRLVYIQVVPYPLDPEQSPVDIHFLLREMEECKKGIPANCEIRLARDFEEGLRGALKRDSVVVVGYHPRPWKTANERMAESLRQAGRKLVLVPKGKTNA